MRNIKKNKLQVDNEIYKSARYNVENLIAKKQKIFFLKTNSKSVLVNTKIQGKLLNHSDYLINLVDV